MLRCICRYACDKHGLHVNNLSIEGKMSKTHKSNNTQEWCKSMRI